MNAELDALGRTRQYYLDLQEKMMEKTVLLLYSCGFYQAGLLGDPEKWVSTFWEKKSDDDEYVECYATAGELRAVHENLLGDLLVETERTPGEIRFWYKPNPARMVGSAQEVNVEGGSS